MLILLDEDVPLLVLPPLDRVLHSHTVHHVEHRSWKGKNDLVVLQHAGASGYDLFVTNDLGQYYDADECRKIKESGVHHVIYRQEVQGLRGLALAIAAIVAAMPRLVDELQPIVQQRLAEITSLQDRKRYSVRDPQRDPPSPYWP